MNMRTQIDRDGNVFNLDLALCSDRLVRQPYLMLLARLSLSSYTVSQRLVQIE